MLTHYLIRYSLFTINSNSVGFPFLFLVSAFGLLLFVGMLFWYRRKKSRSGSSKSGAKRQFDDWLILYGTKSGNSKLVAKQLQKLFLNGGVRVQCKNMASVGVSQLDGLQRLFAVVSTDGEGDPPTSAVAFFKALQEQPKNSLNGLQFTVCALGDSTYENFCKAGKDLENLLVGAGAQPFLTRVDCDADFASFAKKWLNSVIEYIQPGNNTAEMPEMDVDEKKNIIARIVEIQRLTLGDSIKPCYHIQLDFKEDVSFIKPGDSVELVPQNPIPLVQQIAEKIEGENRSEILQFLGTEAELTTLTTNTLTRYQALANHDDLASLLANNDSLNAFLDKANFLDLMAEYPAQLSLAELQQILPKTRGRLYSVASSTQANPQQIHLTVKSIRYKYLDRVHEGAGSIYVTETLKKDALVSLKHYQNLEFRLPENQFPPLIMIGTGTGIAPFRAFMQQYAYHAEREKLWLIWGEKNKANDFVYSNEIHQFEADNVLSKTDLAFSRDSSDKMYVQDVLVREKDLLLKWLEDGACIYVCGSAKMGKDVKRTLRKLLDNNAISTLITLDKLLAENRYREDIY